LPADGAAGGGGGHGLTVRQARGRKAAQPVVDAARAYLAAQCGAEIPLTVDWDSFDPSYRGGDYDGEEGAAGYCKHVVEEAAKMCNRRPEEKRTFVHEVHSMTCHYSAAAGNQYAFALQSGALVAGYGWESGDDGESLVLWLWNTLD
jgi:hypothetical protein